MRRLFFIGCITLHALCGRAGAAEPLDPIVNRAQLLYYEIYDVATRAARIPWELARPFVVRATLRAWVRELVLEDDVRARVLARIDAPDLVDEVVPFLLAVKQDYVADDSAVEPFDAFLRRTYAPEEKIPGMEHSMFSWNAGTGTAEAGEGFALDPELLAHVVTLYDALYLAADVPGAAEPEGLESCARSESRSELRAAVERARPAVREIARTVRARLELDPDIDAAVRATLSDEGRLETVTTTGIEFIDHLVCSSYRVFASRIRREQELRTWMRAQLEEPDGGQLWRYLRFADEERRYGVLVVVDGLQGHLVEALATRRADDPFLTTVVDAQRNAARFAPPTQQSHPAPVVQTEFVRSLAAGRPDDPRYLPFFRDLYDDAGRADPRRPWGLARSGVSTTPTISVRNLPMIETGATVAGEGGTGIPNFHFVDRSFRRPGDAPGESSGRPYYFFGNDAMRLRSLTRQAGMRSLFDRLPHLSSFNCAAQYDEGAQYRIDALIDLAVGEAIRDFAERLCMTELRRRAANERRLRVLRAALQEERDELTRPAPAWNLLRVLARRDARRLAWRTIDEIARLEQRTIPELLLWYDPWPDHFAHFKGPFGDEILAPSGELARLDHWLGVLSDTYREAGVEDRTLFAMAGDHGLTPVFHLLNPEVEVFDALRREGVDFRVAKISSDEGEGPKLNSLFDPPVMRGFDVVVASTAGGNYMLDFFADPGRGWARQPLHHELRALRLLPKSPGGEPIRVDVIAELLSRLGESLDYLAVRERDCDVAGGEVRVIGMRETGAGPGRADAWITRRGDRIFYRYRGADLLDTDRLTGYETLSPRQRAEHASLRRRCLEQARQGAPETWCRERQWRRLASYTPRPDSVVQLAHLYDTDRAGTVNLFPREGIGYNSLVPGRHAGETFHEKDAFVGVWGVPVTRGPEHGRIRAMVDGSVAGAVYEYLTGERPEPGKDGWGFPAIGGELFR